MSFRLDFLDAERAGRAPLSFEYRGSNTRRTWCKKNIVVLIGEIRMIPPSRIIHVRLGVTLHITDMVVGSLKQ